MGGAWDRVRDFLLLLLLISSGSQEEWCKYLWEREREGDR